MNSDDQHLDLAPVVPITEDQRRGCALQVIGQICVSDPPTDAEKDEARHVLEVLGLRSYTAFDSPMRSKKKQRVTRGWDGA